MDTSAIPHDGLPKAVLAVMIHLMLIGLLVALFIRAVPPENHDAFIVVLGVVSGGCTTIWAYYYGSSSGSRAKDAAVANMAASAAVASDSKI